MGVTAATRIPLRFLPEKYYKLKRDGFAENKAVWRLMDKNTNFAHVSGTVEGNFSIGFDDKYDWVYHFNNPPSLPPTTGWKSPEHMVKIPNAEKRSHKYRVVCWHRNSMRLEHWPPTERLGGRARDARGLGRPKCFCTEKPQRPVQKFT